MKIRNVIAGTILASLTGFGACARTATATQESYGRDCPAPHATESLVHVYLSGLTDNYLPTIVQLNGRLMGTLTAGDTIQEFTRSFENTTTTFTLVLGGLDTDGTPHFTDGQYHKTITGLTIPIPGYCTPTSSTTAPPAPSTTAPTTTSPGSSTPSSSAVSVPPSLPPGSTSPPLHSPSTLPRTGSDLPTAMIAGALVALAVGALAVGTTRRRVTR